MPIDSGMGRCTRCMFYMQRSYAVAVRHVSPSRLAGPHDAHHLTALQPVVASHWVGQLDAGQLRLADLCTVTNVAMFMQLSHASASQ